MVEESEKVQRRNHGSVRTAVLAALIDRSDYGYGVAQRLVRYMGPAWEIDRPHIYEVLGQLERDGLASSVEEGRGRRQRRVYSVTARGRSAYERWLRESERVTLARVDLHALVAFSAPEDAHELLRKLEEYELDLMELEEQMAQPEAGPLSWRSAMLGLARAAVGEQIGAEIRWIIRARREIRELKDRGA